MRKLNLESLTVRSRNNPNRVRSVKPGVTETDLFGVTPNSKLNTRAINILDP